jgi:glycosyltransferase involved in cell wall biosynthesis
LIILKNKKSNILIVVESFFDGGAEMFAIKLANELAKTQNVYLLELYPYSTKEKRQLPLLNLKQIKFLQPGKSMLGNYIFKNILNENYYLNNSRKILPRLFSFIKKKKITSLIKKYKIEIVSSHSWDTDVYFSILKNGLEFKLFSTFHGHYEFLADKRINYEVITKNTLSNIDKVIYASPNHQVILDEYQFPLARREKIFIGITMPLSKQVTTYQPGTCLNLVMVARGVKEKGWEEAILAISYLIEKYPGLIKLNLVGEGKFLDFLKAKYVSPHISFLGYKDQIQEILLTCHIGLLPSYAESTPISIIEYLVCGKPVIATNVGAIKEMLTDGDFLAGVCMDLKYKKVNVNDIEAAIESYIANPFLVEKHSKVALNAANKFTMKTCIENYLKVYGINE